MRRVKILIILALLMIIIFLFGYQYVFSIYEISYSIEPKQLYADNISKVNIEVIPLNSFGWRAPLRTTYTDFEIREGKDLVDILELKNEDGILVLKAKDKTGKVGVLIKTRLAVLPSLIEIPVYPNVTMLDEFQNL